MWMVGGVDVFEIIDAQTCSEHAMGWWCVLMSVIGVMIIGSLAELNRAPFDLPEAIHRRWEHTRRRSALGRKGKMMCIVDHTHAGRKGKKPNQCRGEETNSNIRNTLPMILGDRPHQQQQ